jgi:hypothetical protein
MVLESSITRPEEVMATLAALSKSKQPTAAAPPRAPDAVHDSVMAALGAVAAIDTRREELGPRKPKVTSRTQINHVSEHAERISTAKNAALEAYHRRHVLDPEAPVGGAYELDCGTMNPELRHGAKKSDLEKMRAKQGVEQDVELFKPDAEAKLGVHIVGVTGHPKVKDIAPGSLVEGKLEIGDRLISINGNEVDGYAKAIMELKRLSGMITVRVLRGAEEEEDEQ